MSTPRRPSLAGAAFATDEILLEDHMIPSDTPGIEIFVRNRRAAGLSAFSSERTVLFVHGSSYPAETAFDLELDGVHGRSTSPGTATMFIA